MRLMFIYIGLIATMIAGTGCMLRHSGMDEPSVDREPIPASTEDPLVLQVSGIDWPELETLEEPLAGKVLTNAVPTVVLTNAVPTVISRTTIQPGFVMAIRVEVNGRWEIQENAVRVSEVGAIRMPLVGAVEVMDHTLPAVQDRLTVLYKEYFVDPRVEVEFVSEGRHGVFPWGRVTVLGRVGKPGEIALPPTRTFSLVGAIQAAGGFASSANTRSIRITCPEGETRRVSMRDIGRSEEGPEDIILTDGYIIFVPERIF